jgi:hypothetical protein
MTDYTGKKILITYVIYLLPKRLHQVGGVVWYFPYQRLGLGLGLGLGFPQLELNLSTNVLLADVALSQPLVIYISVTPQSCNHP